MKKIEIGMIWENNRKAEELLWKRQNLRNNI